MSTSGKAFDMNLFKRVLERVKPYKGKFFLALFLTIFIGGLGVVRPYLIMIMVNDYVAEHDKSGLLLLTLIIVGLLFVEAILMFFQVYIASWLGQSVIKDLRTDLFKHITQFNLKYFDNTPIGALVTRAVSDIETIAEIFSQGILTIIGDILKLILIVAVMFSINWEFTLVVLIPIPILLLATRWFKNTIQKSFQQVRTQVSRLNTFVQEHITGMSIVQVFNREEEEHRQFNELNESHKVAHIKAIWAYSVFFPVVEVLSAASIALLIYFGVLKLNDTAYDGKLLFGEVLAFIFYIFMMYRPIRMLADRFNVLQMGMVGADRVFKVLDTEAVITDEGSHSPADIKGKIELKDVWFSYTGDEDVLKGVSFSVEAGKTIALVGATGAGKSSIVNLLSRFYEYQKGSIKIDDVDIREYKLEALRKNIAVVLQDVFLFSDSIKNNIILHDENISDEELIEAAKIVGVHDFIMKLPNGYNHDVGERGGTLSVGQRQLLAFLRAYIYNPKILVLDEATSSVDTESEILIQTAIEKLTKGRTSIIVAHRLSTIKNADVILVLDKGEIVEKGSHAELLQKDGYYKRLFEYQFDDSII